MSKRLPDLRLHRFLPPLTFLVISTLTVVPGYSQRGRRPAPDPWERAVAARQALEDTPAEQRTKEQFEDVMNAFRRIYHENPQASKAPAAVAAVADLLAEKGRVLRDDRALRSAIGQYEFLMQQYPKSPQVDSALLVEGEICRQDLKDKACAREKLSAVVAAEPGTSFAEQAALELKELDGKPAKQLNAASVDAPASKPKTASAVRQDVSKNTTAGDESAVQPDVVEASSAQLEAFATGGAGHVIVQITGMRHWSNPTSTRIAIDLGGKVAYEAVRVPNPDRIYFDLHGARLAPRLNGRQLDVIDDGFLKRIRAAQFQPGVTRVVLDVTDVSEFSAFLLPNPWRLIIDIHGSKQAPHAPVSATGYSVRAATPPPSNAENTAADVARLSSDTAKVPATAGPTSEPVSARVKGMLPDAASDDATDVPSAKAMQPDAGALAAASRGKSQRKGKSGAPVDDAERGDVPHAADPASDGQRSLVRALGLKVGRIVIDAGHGGHDSGTLGPGGIEEKDVVLDVALRTGKLLHSQLGAEIVYTRDDDTFIPLETRTAIANKAQADLFLSIHGNSSREPSARGVETYYLNFTADPNALDVAARENALSSHSVHQLSDLVRKITLKDKIDESREFAADVDQGLFAGLRAGNPGLKDRGVKKAPFVVLIGAQMPSVLAEISFLTNPEDADELRQGAYRQRIAESLAGGVERYLRGLSGTGPGSRPVEKAKSSTRTLARSSEEPAGK